MNVTSYLSEHGILFILELQKHLHFLTPAMQFFSFTGTENFFFLILPLIYWCFSPVLGIRVMMVLVASSYFNYTLKILFAWPRPYWVNPEVVALWTESSFGIPSGHAQNSAVIWGMIASYFQKTWLTFAMIGLIFLIGFSRLCLGSHFPHDVVLGWFLGTVLLWVALHFWKPIHRAINEKNIQQQIFLSFELTIFFLAFGLMTLYLRKGFQLPQIWISNALLAGGAAINPMEASGLFTILGSFLGFCLGLIWTASNGGFTSSRKIKIIAVRFLIGLCGIGIFWLGLGSILPRGDGSMIYSLRFLRYVLVGTWITGGAPGSLYVSN